MDKAIYIAFIKLHQIKSVTETIGKIDTELIQEESLECLYYILPLIERIILEIFKLVPGADIEHLEQGIMKTPMSIVERNNALETIPSYILELIEKYYKEDGLRNIILHPNTEAEEISIDFTEILLLLTKTLSILKNKVLYTSIENFDDIDYL